MKNSKVLKYLMLPARVCYKLYYLVVFALSLVITYPLMYFLLKKEARFPGAFQVIRWHAKALLFFAGVKLNVEGVNNIPKDEPYIICPNHTSFLDIFCIYATFKDYLVFVGKKEIEKWPLFHIYYTSGMNILVDRHNKTGALKAFKRMSQELRSGRPLAIFPEGTIARNPPELGEFKDGAFSLAIMNSCKVLPVSLKSNWKRLPRGKFLFGSAGPGFSEMVIHPAVPTVGMKKNNMEELKEKVRGIIFNEIDA